VTFKPSSGTFTKVEFEFAILEARRRCGNWPSSIRASSLSLKDDRHVPAQEVAFEFIMKAASSAFVEWLDRSQGTDDRSRRSA
jgi:DNA gyrase subunit B